MTQNIIRKTFSIDLTQKDLNQEDEMFFKVSGLVAGYNNIDHDNDILVKGLFDKSIKQRISQNRPFPVLFNHKTDKPIGIADEFNFDREDGLASTAKLIKASEFVSKEIIPLVKGGAIAEFSVGFLKQEWDYDTKKNITTITKGRLIEYSLVVKGANDNALVENFKSFLEKTTSIRELEDLLADKFGLTGSERKTLISKIKEFSTQRDVEEKTKRDALESNAKSSQNLAKDLNNLAIKLALNNINKSITK